MSRGWVLFLRLHGAAACAAGSALHALAVAVIGQVTVSAGISSPSTTVDVPLYSLVPAVAVLAFVPIVGDPVTGEESAVRRVVTYRWAVLLALITLAIALLFGAVAPAGDWDTAVVVSRNLVGFLGLSVLLRPWLGDAAWLCPPMVAAAELVFGGTAYQVPAGWAWTLHAADSASALLASLALACFAALALARSWVSRSR